MNAILTRREVNVVAGQGTIRGLLMKCETDLIDDKDPKSRYFSVRLEHAGIGVKVPCTKQIFDQLGGESAIGQLAEFDLDVGAAPDTSVRNNRGNNYLRLDYIIVGARVLAGDQVNAELSLPGAKPKTKGGVFGQG